jgi:hypothetical protein
MAKIIDKPVFTGRDLYPWDEWFDGQMRLLTRGEDFQTTAQTMCNSIAGAAQRRRVTVQVVKHGDQIQLQAILLWWEPIGTHADTAPGGESLRLSHPPGAVHVLTCHP